MIEGRFGDINEDLYEENVQLALQCHDKIDELKGPQVPTQKPIKSMKIEPMHLAYGLKDPFNVFSCPNTHLYDL